MDISQREQNPDVNSYNPDVDTGEGPETVDDDVIPVPPDVEGNAPIKEPPGSGGPPVGDVDDSPKRIAWARKP